MNQNIKALTLARAHHNRGASGNLKKPAVGKAQSTPPSADLISLLRVTLSKDTRKYKEQFFFV